MTNIVILNGPPRCGKDTAANALQAFFGEEYCEHLKLSQPLKDIVAAIAGRPYEILEENKDGINVYGMPLSHRDAQIGLFEAVSKVFSEDWLARIAANKIHAIDKDLIVMSDGGRHAEVNHLIKQCGARNIFVLQIVRRGCTFNGDIRNYINDSRVVTSLVINDDLTNFTIDVVDEVTQWLGDR